MALTDLEKKSFRRGIADEAAYEELIDIIDGGSATELSENAKIVLGNALRLDRAKAGIVDAFESGGATLTDEEQDCLRQLMGGDPEGDSLITEIEAIAGEG